MDIDIERLKWDAEYWLECDPSDGEATHFEALYSGHQAAWVRLDRKQRRHYFLNYAWVCAEDTNDDIGPIESMIPRPTKPAAPNRTALEWSDWKIPSGSWPYWMLERMNRETGRMSYDNPVKGMIRDLWQQVDRKPAAPEWDGEGWPLAGTWVEGQRNMADWIECFFIGHDDKGKAWFKTYNTNNESNFSVFGSTMPIRPIRTQADRDRDELIEILENTPTDIKFGQFDDAPKDLADAIIAAGYRKEK